MSVSGEMNLEIGREKNPGRNNQKGGSS